MMFSKVRLTVRLLILATLSIGCELANTSIAVANASFETIPISGLPFVDCASGCSYSNGSIPGWINAGFSGQFQPGNPSNSVYFSYLPAGITSAYSNGGLISQTVLATAQAGITYTLSVERGNRFDTAFAGGVDLVINGVHTTATGSIPDEGGWSTWTATYTAVNSGAIEIQLYSDATQANFDNVVLSATPEPGFYAVLAIGLSGLAFARRRLMNN